MRIEMMKLIERNAALLGVRLSLSSTMHGFIAAIIATVKRAIVYCFLLYDPMTKYGIQLIIF